MKTSINAAIKKHHDLVKEKGFDAVMTVLIGAQNYKLDDEQSDIDTMTFILPPIEDIYSGALPISGEFETDDGKCSYKDIRSGLNLLRCSTPNIIECFLGKYRYFNPKYASVLNKYLNNRKILNYLVHCNYSYMLQSASGMAKELMHRNMNAGKAFSHILRLRHLVTTYISTLDTRHLLELSGNALTTARAAKRDTERDEYYTERSHYVIQQIDNQKATYLKTEKHDEIEQRGLSLINQFQKEIFKKYMEGIND